MFLSSDGNVEIRFALDFLDERLLFDIFEDLTVLDPGTAEGAAAIAEIKQFFFAYLGNGELQIFEATSGNLLSRKDPFIPLNLILDPEAAETEIARWLKLAEERRSAPKRSD